MSKLLVLVLLLCGLLFVGCSSGVEYYQECFAVVSAMGCDPYDSVVLSDSSYVCTSSNGQYLEKRKFSGWDLDTCLVREGEDSMGRTL